MRNFFKNYWALGIPVLVLAVALLVFLQTLRSSDTNELIGMVDATSVDVASSMPGRLDSVLVHLGSEVKKGDLLAVVSSSEINALQAQARAAIDAATGQLDLLKSGASPELLGAARNLYEISQEQYKLFNTTYQRMQNLYNADVISGQEKDLVYFKFQAAKKEMETARLNLQLLENGSRPELIRSADAVVRQAQQAYELTSSLSGNTRIYAPSDGKITSLVAHEGEVVSVGYPMMTLERSNSAIIRFNVRQNQPELLEIGKKIQVRVPGCDPEYFEAEVSSVSPSLTFANWIPSKDKGEFELRTFTIELSPDAETIRGLRSGMTASLTLP